MDKNGKTYTIIVFIKAICLLGCLVFLNTRDFSKQENNTTTTVTTTKQIIDLIYDKTENILIDGEYVEIPIKTYINSLFKIEYDVQTFNIINTSNGDLYIKGKDNDENYLCIQTLTYDDYQAGLNKETETTADNNGVELTKVSYINFEGTETYLKVIINIANANEYDKLMPRFNYMLSTLVKP